VFGYEGSTSRPALTAFLVLDPRAFIAQLKPSTNENSRTTRGTDGSSVKTTWKWGTRAREIGRKLTDIAE
jgi:hypothetical protein